MTNSAIATQPEVARRPARLTYFCGTTFTSSKSTVPRVYEIAHCRYSFVAPGGTSAFTKRSAHGVSSVTANGDGNFPTVFPLSSWNENVTPDALLPGVKPAAARTRAETVTDFQLESMS